MGEDGIEKQEERRGKGAEGREKKEGRRGKGGEGREEDCYRHVRKYRILFPV